jgi:excisionase family DNA binding protein
MPKEFTSAQAARRLGITLDAIYKLIYADKLPAKKVGTRWLVSETAVETRLQAREARCGTAGR